MASNFLKINPPPLGSPLKGEGGGMSVEWGLWFEKVFKTIFSITPSVSGDIGDADVTLKTGKNAMTQRFDTALTALRTITLDAEGTFNGARFEIVREAGATGASGLDVGGLKTLAASQWCVVEHDGTAWRLVQYGTL